MRGRGAVDYRPDGEAALRRAGRVVNGGGSTSMEDRMVTPKNRTVSRTLGLLGVLTAPAVVWFGWWSLAISGALAVASAALAPRRKRERHPARRLIGRLDRRLHPHRWRPGPRLPRRK